MLIRRLVLLAITLLASGCSPLIAFDTLVPKDRGGVRVAQRGVILRRPAS